MPDGKQRLTKTTMKTTTITEEQLTHIGYYFDTLLENEKGTKEIDGVCIESCIENDYLHLMEYCKFTKAEANTIDSILTHYVNYGHSRREALAAVVHRLRKDRKEDARFQGTGITRRALYLAESVMGGRGLSDAEMMELSRLNE